MNKDYLRIKSAIHFLEDNFDNQPSLDDLSKAIHLSPYHLQRLFKRWAGVTPKQFLACVTQVHSNKLLQSGTSLLQTSESVGLSSPSRLHDLYVNLTAMSPAEYRNKGKGLCIDYGIHDTVFGKMLIGLTDKGICTLEFISQQDINQVSQYFTNLWENAQISYQPNKTETYVEKIFTKQQENLPINLHVGGTNFQLRVWNALLSVPFAHTSNYKTIAESINMPGASRAVGTAIGKNPISLLIPCHRVIRSNGLLGNYRWGENRKKTILTWEKCQMAA